MSKIREGLIRCIRCRELICLTPFDSFPEYQIEGDQSKEVSRNDRMAFEEKHKGHPLEFLYIRESSLVSKFPWNEPVREDFFEAFNKDRSSFIIKRWRESIEESMKYQIVGRGHLVVKLEEVEIQEADIRKAIKRESAERGLEIKDSQIDFLIAHLESQSLFFSIGGILKKFPEEQIARNKHPLNLLIKLDEQMISSMLDFLGYLLEKRELQFVKDFLNLHNDFDDVLVFKVRQNFEIFSTETS